MSNAETSAVYAQEIMRLKKENAAQLAELTRIAEALGTNEGHSSVTHIETLREQLKDCSAVVDRQQEMLDRNQEKVYEQGFIDGVQKNSESRVSKFMDKKWVGLTDEQIKQCSYDANGFMIDREVAMRAVESKLKEKNT
jgi:hypothetical protein